MLLRFPILRQPDHGKPFYIYTDASGYALGAILSQFDDESNEHVCQYASRLLKGAEIHYGITEIECLAVVLAIRQFRTYVHGVLFYVITDHNCASMAYVNTRSLGGISTLGYLFEII